MDKRNIQLKIDELDSAITRISSFWTARHLKGFDYPVLIDCGKLLGEYRNLLASRQMASLGIQE